ncbi:PREDICTED: uncharacterized protein LOC109173030 [Ipomoea nil]|uniref:uncharacterized protein LOC109173030 n=1 Tax=Ipomoea nil TaxID=35883 RepID=UPI000901D1E6|nr:PREDICTED: uncharacterized protein LOC109173030 [Ipomoea nil]
MEAGQNSWLMTVVYGSPDHSLRRKLFEDLSGDRFDPQGPWLTVGDFNSVTCKEEVSNSESYSHTRCSQFNNWIHSERLIDLGYTGSSFTWMRGVDKPSFKAARLDRALSNIEWKLRFPNAEVQHLPMINSDHSPLLLNTDRLPIDPTLKSFRFNSAWNIVGNIMVRTVKKFFDEGHLPHGCNDTLLPLIPKVPAPENVKQFRPIGLCNVSYKLITKIMTIRLKEISRKLVGQHQSSFIPGRQILENILIYQEVLNSMRNKKRKNRLDADES